MREEGMTLVELLIASLILAIMAVFIGNFLINSFDNNLFIQASGDLGNYSQQTVNTLRLDLTQSKKIFDRRDSGLGFWNKLQFPSEMRPLLGSRLPEIVQQGSFAPSKFEDLQKPFVQDAVGNILFFVEYLPAFESREDRFVIDRFRFVVEYLKELKEGSFDAQNPKILDLVRCESGAYADLVQVADVRDEIIRTKILQGLEAEKVETLWDSQAEPIAAFASVSGFTSRGARDPEHRIQLKNCQSVIKAMGRLNRTLGTIAYSVAMNSDEAFRIRDVIPKYAKPLLGRPLGSVPSFPHGFEVMVIGPKTSRQVFIRLVLAASLRKMTLSRESMIIATTKDS